MQKIKKLKYFIILILIFLLFSIYHLIIDTEIHVVNVNFELNLPKPKSVIKVFEPKGRDDNTFYIFQYSKSDIEVIKQQISLLSDDLLYNKIETIFNHLISEKEKQLFSKYIINNYLDSSHIYYHYIKKSSFVLLLIFDEESQKLYYIAGWVGMFE